MGEALSKWIEGSRAALSGIEAERDRQASLLETARRDAATQREAMAELDRQLAKITEDRKRHAARLAELDHEIKIGTASLEGLEQDLEAMNSALQKVSDRPPGSGAPPPAPKKKSTLIGRTGVPAGTQAPPAAPASVVVTPAPPKAPTKTVVPESKTAADMESNTTMPARKLDPLSPLDDDGLVPEAEFDELEAGLQTKVSTPAKRSKWRVVAGVGVVLAVLVGGGGYAATQTDAGAQVFENVRARVQSVLGT